VAVLALVGAGALSACGGQSPAVTAVTPASPAPATTRVAAAGPPPLRYRLAGAPIALLQETSSGPAFQVRVRMDRRLPSGAQGVQANMLVGKSGSDSAPVPFGRRSRHCYAAVIGNDFPEPALANPHPGTIVRVTILIHGQRSIVRSVPLKPINTDLTALGCGKL
jgi:hypothetical protein